MHKTSLESKLSQAEPEKPSYSQPHESRNRDGSAELKKEMKKASPKPFINSDFARRLRTSLPQQVLQPGKPPPSAAQPVDVQKASLQRRQCLPTNTQITSLKQSPIKTSNGSSPNYMKPTSSSNSRKERSQVSATNSSLGKKPGRTLTGTSSLKRVPRSLTKTPSFKPLRRTRPSSKKCPQVTFSAQFQVQQATCSSILKDSKFPAYTLLAPGGKQSEGTSVPKVCPYTYCSLNDHHCPPLPSSRCSVAARRPSLKTLRSAKSGAPSIRPEEKPAFQEKGFFIEISAAEMEEGQGTELPHSDTSNANMDKQGGSPEGNGHVKAVCGCDTGSEATDMDWEEGQFSFQNDNHEADDSVHCDDGTHNTSGYSSEFENSDSVFESYEYNQVEMLGRGECFEEEEDETDKNIDNSIGTVVTSTEVSIATIETLAMKSLLPRRANSFLDLPDEALKINANRHENQTLTDSIRCDDETNLGSGCSFEITNSGEGPIFMPDNHTVCQNRKIDEPNVTMVSSMEVSEAKIEMQLIKPLLLKDENQNLIDSVCCDDETNLESGCFFEISNSAEEPIFVPDNDTVCQNRKIDEFDDTMVSSKEDSEAKIETNLIKPLLLKDPNHFFDVPDEALMEADEALIEADQHDNQANVNEALIEAIGALMEADQHENQALVDEALMGADEALMEADENQSLTDKVWEANAENLPIKPLLFDGLTDEAPIDDAQHENETLQAGCPLFGKQISSDHKEINEDENKEDVLEESMHPNTPEMGINCKDATSSSMKTAIFKAGRGSNQELADTWNKLKSKKGCPRADTNGEEPRKFNPRGPNFLPRVAEPEAEKVDLRHQMIDERKNTEDWMLDYALQKAVNKLTPAQNRKVALLVEAFETVLPIPKRETHLRHPPQLSLSPDTFKFVADAVF